MNDLLRVDNLTVEFGVHEGILRAVDNVDLNVDRGDVSAVNYGANPYTSVMARQAQVFADIRHLEGAALERARQVVDETRHVEEDEPVEAPPAATVGRGSLAYQLALRDRDNDRAPHV